MAKQAPAAIDPANLGSSIVVDDEPVNGNGISTHGEPAPPLLHHEPMPPPSMGQQQKTRRLAAAPAPAPAAATPPVSPRKDIARMIPSSHRVYVYKRHEDGQLSFINEYSAQDLQGVGTIEVFIKKYVSQAREGGKFVLYYFDPSTKQLEPQPMGTVSIEPPFASIPGAPVLPAPRQEPTLAEQMREVLEVQKLAQQSQPAQSKSPMEEAMAEMMKGMMQKQMAAMASGEQSKDGGSGMMMMFMMMQLMNSQQQKPQTDAGMTRAIEKMIEKIERLEEEQRHLAMVPPPSPALPPSPEGPSPMEMFMTMMSENNKLLISAMQGQNRERDPIKDMAELAVLLQPKNDTLTTADLFKMLPQMRDMLVPPGAAKDPFEKTIENFRLFKMMQREFGEGQQQQQAPSDEANFWSFAKGLIQSDIGKSIATQILSQGAGDQMASQHQQRQASQAAQARAVAQRRAQEAARQKQLADVRASQLTAGAEKAAAEAQVAEKAAAEAQARAAAQQAAAAEKAQAQTQQQGSEEDDDEGIFVPPGFLEVNAPAIASAPNDAERIGAIITGFQVLAMSPDFRPVMTKMFGLCKQNRRLEALDHLKEILEFFVENEVFEKDLPEKAAADFDRHWKLIRARLEFEDIPEVFPEGHPNAVAAAPREEAVEAAQ